MAIILTIHVESNEITVIFDLFCEELAFADLAMLLKHEENRLLWEVFLVFLCE